MVRRAARRLVGCVGSAWALAGPLGAQSPSCDSVFVARDGAWMQDTLFLAVEGGYGIRPVPDEQAQLALLFVSDSLRLPEPFPLPPVVGRMSVRPAGDAFNPRHVASQALAAEAFVRFSERGEVKQIGLSQTSLAPAVDAALVDALQRAVPAGALRVYADAARGIGGVVFVQLRTLPLPRFGERVTIKEQIEERNRSTLVPEIVPERRTTRGGIATFPLRVLRVPVVQATTSISERKRGPSPSFPTGELNRSFDGTVHVEFVVGANGRLVPGTLRLADAATYGYAAAVLRSLERYEWNPAMAGGCPVAQHISYSFRFEVR